jgi:hypothetical protein
MRRPPILIVVVALSATVSGVSSAEQPRGELIERTLAIVGGSAVTQSDVRTALALGLVTRGADTNAATEKLIERALMLREVERYAPTEPSESQVDSRVAALRSPFPDAEFAALLAAGGFSTARLRAWVRDDLRIAAYLDQRFAADGPERRASLIADWVVDLRRRTPVVELWKR